MADGVGGGVRGQGIGTASVHSCVNLTTAEDGKCEKDEHTAA